jgi:type VI secretion system protein ImpJ
MFLAPQHMQQADNYRDAVNGLMTYAQLPFPWGVESIKVDENFLPSFQFIVHQIKAITPSKEVVFFPGNLEIPSRSFEGIMSDPQQRVHVYLGIPDYQHDGPNLSEEVDGYNSVGRHRYRSVEMESADENTGLSERMIQIRKIRGRIFFEGEDMQGFQIMPIARIMPAPNMQGAMMDETYIPPLLRVSGWPSLQENLNGVASRLAALQSNLQRAIGSKGILEWCGGARGIELILKMQAVNQVLLNIQQVSHAPDATPFFAYNELLRTIGTFWTFKGDQPLKAPPFYDHFRIGDNFKISIEIFRRLCAILDAQGYIQRQFAANHDRMEVDLEQEWLSGDRKLYICINGAGGYNDVMKKMAAIKVCAPSHYVQVLQRRIQAIQIQWMRQPPSSLPATEGSVYAEIIQSGRFWPGVVTESALAVGSSEKFPYRLDLFVE